VEGHNNSSASEPGSIA